MSKDFRPSVKSVSFHSNCDRGYLRLFCTNRIESSPIDSFPLFPGVQSIPSHRSLALGSSPSAIGRRGAAWSRLSAGLDSRLTVALSDQRDQRGSMQRLSTAVTDVLPSCIVLSDVTASCMLCMMSQHAVTACHCDTCCDSEMSVLRVSEVTVCCDSACCDSARNTQGQQGHSAL